MTLEDIATRLCNVLAKAVIPALPIAPAPNVLDTGMMWREIPCTAKPADIERAIQLLAEDAKQRGIVQFFELPIPLKEWVQQVVAADPARNIVVRVTLQPWPKSCYTLEYMARCASPNPS